jgi:4-nitrophenyl phosphatase
LNPISFLTSIHALLIDADGTLWQGTEPLPGLIQFFHFLETQQISFQIATNNSTAPARYYRDRLAGFGVEVGLKHIFTAAQATAEYLRQVLEPGSRIYMIGEDGLREALEEAGFVLLVDSDQSAAAVVVGGDPNLTYSKLKHATLSIQRGALFVGTNPDRVFPTEEGLVPECGTTLAALEAATGLAPMVIGKPNFRFYERCLQSMGATAGHTAAVGDRLETDVGGAQSAGLRGILVTTGVDDESAIPAKDIQPDLIVHSLTELVVLWENALQEKLLS